MSHSLRPWRRLFPFARPTRHTAALRLEALEGRDVPANSITAVQTGTLLTITGLDDFTSAGVAALDNDQVVTITGSAVAGEFIVSVGGATEFLIGGVPTIDDQKFTKVAAIKLDMRQGDDQVTIVDTSLTGEVTFLGGGGNDQLIIDANGKQRTLGSVKVTNGDGNDSFQIGNGNITVSKALTINNGVGNSEVKLGTTATDKLTVGSLAITNGDGTDNLDVSGATFTALGAVAIANGNGDTTTTIAAQAVELRAGVSLTNGAGHDAITIGFLDVTDPFNPVLGSVLLARGATIVNKSGGSKVELAGTTTLGGNISVTSLDGFDEFFAGDVQLQLLSAGKFATAGVSLNTGNGGSLAEFNVTPGLALAPVSTTLSSITVKNGAGQDTVQVGGQNFTVNGTTSIANGTGGSTVSLIGVGTVTLGGAATVTNGAGDDLFFLGDLGKTAIVNARAITIANGSGGSLTQLTGKTVSLSGPLAVTNLDGADTLILDASTLTTTKAGITYKAGNGGADITVGSTALFDVGGTVALENGAGDLVVNYGLTGVATRSLGLTVKNGAGSSILLMDGNVTIGTVAAAGNLTVTAGDGLDKFQSAGALTINGAATWTLGAGGSEVKFQGPTLVTKALTFTAGDGDDQFEVTGASFEVDGATKIGLGLSDGQVTSGVRFQAATNTFLGTLSVTSLAGLDAVSFGNQTNAKAVTLSLGNDAGTVTFENGGNTLLEGPLTITTGDGDDRVDVIGHTFNAVKSAKVTNVAVSITTGAGADEINWFGQASKLDAVTFKTGDGADILRLANWTATGVVLIETGALDDLLELDNSAFNNAVTLNTGSGNDQVSIEKQDIGGKTTFASKVTVKLDAGNDILDIGVAEDFTGPDEDDFVVFLGAISLDGGTGLDRAFVLPVTSGGDRRNQLPVIPVALAGVELLE